MQSSTSGWRMLSAKRSTSGRNHSSAQTTDCERTYSLSAAVISSEHCSLLISNTSTARAYPAHARSAIPTKPHPHPQSQCEGLSTM